MNRTLVYNSTQTYLDVQASSSCLPDGTLTFTFREKIATGLLAGTAGIFGAVTLGLLVWRKKSLDEEARRKAQQEVFELN